MGYIIYTVMHYTGYIYTVMHYTGYIYSDTLYRVYSDTLYRVYRDTLYRVSNDESIVFCGSHVYYWSFFFQMNIFNLDVLYIIWNYYTVPMQQTARSSFWTT